MKKILTFILFALLLLPLEGQIGRYPFYTPIVSGIDVDSASWHVDYKTVYYAIPVDDRPRIDTADLQNTLVASLDTLDYWTTNGKSVWGRMDLLYIFAQKTNDGAEIMWKAPAGDFNLSDGDTITFTQYRGYTGDGTNDYLNTSFNTSTDAVNISQDSITFGGWVLNNVSSTSQTIGGNYDTDGTDSRIFLNPRNNTIAATYITADASMSGTISPATSAGLTVVTRSASNVTELYKDGVSIGTDTDTRRYLPPENLYILAQCRDGAAYIFSGLEVAIIFLMDKITDEESAAIYTIFHTYLTAIGL
jgi:hypothetical protein